jgi:hypothetical protein
MRRKDGEEDEEVSSRRNDSAGRQHHRNEALRHQRLAESSEIRAVRLEHLYATGCHFSVAESPYKLTGDHRHKAA